MAETGEVNVVTGALGYTGKYIARRLLARGIRVVTLTGHLDRPNPFGDQVAAAPFSFDDPEALAAALRGARVLFNTYWVRFPRGEVTYDEAVRNSRTLIRAAADAGVKKIVHISIVNASKESRLPYFRGKGLVEEAVVESGIPYSILRPTVIFGVEDILINNIAWLLRRFPVFAVPGSGSYRIQPVYVEDVADLAVRVAGEDSSTTTDAAGPEVYTFDDLVRLIGRAVGSRARVLHLPSGLALKLSGLIGAALGDVVLTRDEVRGLMAGLLVARGAATGTTRLSDWLARNAGRVGARYASEVKRHYR